MKLIRKNFAICSADLELLEACPGAGVYTMDVRQRTSPAMWYGIFLHYYLELLQRGQGGQAHREHVRAAALEWVADKAPKLLATCKAIDIDEVPLGEAEMPYGHDPYRDVGRRLRGVGGKLRINTELFGKADLIHDEGGLPQVLDWKSGELGGRRAADSTQLMGLACSVRTEACTSDVGIALVGVRSNGRFEWDTHVATGVELNAFAERCRKVHLSVLNARAHAELGAAVDFNRSEHCQWCHCRHACPAWR